MAELTTLSRSLCLQNWCSMRDVANLQQKKTLPVLLDTPVKGEKK